VLCDVPLKQHEVVVQESEEHKTALTNQIDTVQTELVQLRAAHADEVCDNVMHFL
jgi:hypothetical protein